MTDEEIYTDDDAHPLPRLATCDINGVKKTGGSDLVIVIASPLKSDARSKQRLVRKIKNYLSFIQSDDFTKEAGAPSPANTSIIVNINGDSDDDIFDLLDQCRGWVLDNHASLVVQAQPRP